MNECVERLLKVIRETHTPLLLEVVKSIASLCSVDPYMLWDALAHGTLHTATPQSTKPSTPSTTTVATKPGTSRTVTGPCWRCPACGKEFTNVKHLVNHILFYVRQRDKAHIDVYRKIKQRVEQTGQTFTQVVMSELQC